MVECEYLFCHKPATTRLTVPHVKPGAAFCDEHCHAMLAFAERYRGVIGAVQVEAIKCDRAGC